MIRLAKYLKPYLLLILIAIAMLFAQAMADLALPDYMSDIINVGIQQGGVTNAVPLAIRQSEMDKITILMTAAEKSAVLGDYILVDQSSPDFEKTLKEYPTVANEPVYVLNTSDKAEIEKLNPVMGKALLAVSTITQIMADPSKAAVLTQGTGFDLSTLPAGTDIFALLSTMPAAQLSQMTTAINSEFASMSSSMITQSAISSVRAEYAALGMDTAKLQSNYILRTGSMMLLLTLLSVACSIVVGFLSAKIAAGLARDIRRDTFKKVESFSKTEFDKFSTASLITRSTNDVTQIQMAVIMIIRMAFYAPIMGVGAVIYAVEKSPSLTWIIALGVVILISLVVSIFSIALPKFKIIQSLIDRLNLVTRENLSGMMVIRAFNNQKFEENRFDKANLDLTNNSLFVNRVMVIMMPMMTVLMNGMSLLIIWVGAHEVAQSLMQVGDMMAFLQYAMQVVMSFLMLSIMFIILPRASVSANRIADVLAVDLVIKDPEEPKVFSENAKWKVEFRHVSFRYPGAEEDVLHDINFTALPGQTTAIIGSTGSGKSTVVNLIPRFYDVTDGAIYIDGLDIREVKQSDLRDKIGYIPQKGMLFSGTIESNLRYADENASMETLKSAADIAQATEFISTMTDGMASEISQGGMNVSGGQKQRLAIARALVKKPPIYIFDDSFSALDYKTDSALRKALKESTGSSTILIVAQRISTIKNAEQIVVLDEGRVVGKGTHKELMETCKTYREIALSQLSKEELA
ncbi:MAG: ABC transporter ATP-binding protein [Anaerolineaceae bacterium]|jgi:ATP-binding cassette subfamily B protein|nr:MAG: ABC transporter ATP-binding protein [Anaerolineaceae bacterium]